MLSFLTKFVESFASRWLRSKGQREPLFLEMLMHGLGDGKITLIDIGSDDGSESIHALHLKGQDLTVHLLEPDPANLEVCRQNISQKCRANSDIHYHSLAVSNRIYDGFFYRNPESSNLNSASPTSDANVEFKVSYTTLDHFLAANLIQPPLMIKMDIEGHEVDVLEGFLAFASANSGVKILMEVHPSLYTAQRSLERVLKKLFALGFRATYVESAGVPVPEKFEAGGLEPVKVVGSRALYRDLENDFVLETACYENLNPVGDTGRVTRKIVRSILLEKK